MGGGVNALARDVEQQAHLGAPLRHHAQAAVILAAGRRREAQRHLLLEHQCQRFISGDILRASRATAASRYCRAGWRRSCAARAPAPPRRSSSASPSMIVSRPGKASASSASAATARGSRSMAVTCFAPASSSARVSPPGPGPISTMLTVLERRRRARDPRGEVGVEQEMLAERFYRRQFVAANHLAERRQTWRQAAARWRACAISPASLQRGDQAGGIGLAGAGDVERGAVIGRGADEGQAEGDVDAAVEIDGLERDQRLVVIHAQRRVVTLARLGMEQRVGGEGAAGGDALRRATPRPPARSVSISSRPMVPCSPACGLRPATARRGCAMPKSRASAAAAMRPAATMRSVRQRAQRLAQRLVDRHRHHAQSGAHQHHRDRRAAQLGEIFGVAGMRKAGGVERLFLDRIGDQSPPRALPGLVWHLGESIRSPQPHWRSQACRRRRDAPNAATRLAAPGGISARPFRASPPRSARSIRVARRAVRAGPDRRSEKMAGRHRSRRASQARKAISPPMPAGSPMVSASAAVIREYPRRRCAADRANSAAPERRDADVRWNSAPRRRRAFSAPAAPCARITSPARRRPGRANGLLICPTVSSSVTRRTPGAKVLSLMSVASRTKGSPTLCAAAAKAGQLAPAWVTSCNALARRWRNSGGAFGGTGAPASTTDTVASFGLPCPGKRRSSNPRI